MRIFTLPVDGFTRRVSIMVMPVFSQDPTSKSQHFNHEEQEDRDYNNKYGISTYKSSTFKYQKKFPDLNPSNGKLLTSRIKLFLLRNQFLIIKLLIVDNIKPKYTWF